MHPHSLMSRSPGTSPPPRSGALGKSQESSSVQEQPCSHPAPPPTFHLETFQHTETLTVTDSSIYPRICQCALFALYMSILPKVLGKVELKDEVIFRVGVNSDTSWGPVSGDCWAAPESGFPPVHTLGSLSEGSGPPAPATHAGDRTEFLAPVLPE